MLFLSTLASPGLAAPWVQTTSLPDGYTAHSPAYASSYLYQAGGNSGDNGIIDGTNVFYAHVNIDGTIGNWNAATSLPEAVSQHAGVAAKGFAYVLGGLHYNLNYGVAITNIVYYAKINADGSLSSWNTANPLPDTLESLSAAVWHNCIYVIGGNNGSVLTNSVYSATIQTDGSLSVWTAQAPIPVGTSALAEVANGFLYALGGAASPNTVYYTKINADGTLGGWNQTALLPQGVSNFGAVAANGWVFSIAGYDGTEATSGFYGATANGDGSLGSWSAGTSLPIPLFFHAVAASGSYIFVTGGTDGETSSSNVYSMSLPLPPATPTLLASGLTNGNFQLQLTSSTNTGFGLLASTDLTTWTNIGWGFTDTNGSLLFQDTNAANFPRRFYRAYWPLP